MNRYILGAILLGNLALAMDEPTSDVNGGLGEHILHVISEIRQTPKETLRHQYSQVNLNNPKDAVEKAVAETILQQEQWERDIPTMSKAELDKLSSQVSPWYWISSWQQKIKNRLDELTQMAQLQDIELKQKIAADQVLKKFGPVDSIVSEMELRAELDKARDTVLAQSAVAETPIRQMNKEQIEALIKKNTGMFFTPDSEYLKAIEERCKELKMWPYDKNPEIPAAAEQLPTFDQIASMTEEQIKGFEEKLIASGQTISPFIQKEINRRRESLKFEKDWKAEMWRPEAEQRQATEGKKVHFQGVASDSDGSGIARPNKPSVALADEPLAPEELGLGLAAKPAATQPQVEDSSSDSDMPGLEPVPEIELKKGTAEGNAATTSGQKHSVPGFNIADVPAPFTKDDFENLLPDEDFNGSNGAAAAPEVKVGKDVARIPVADSADPLARAASPTEPIETPATRVATKSPPPCAQDFKAEPSASPAPDTSGDAALAAQLTEEGKTPGGPDSPKLPIVEVRKGDSVSSGSCVGSITDLKATQQTEEGQTPGGPDSSQSESDSDDDSQNEPEFSNLQKGLIAATVVAVVYGGAEMVLAYKSIQEKEWKQASGFMSKAHLLLGKTWKNVQNRPSQLVSLVKQAPAAGATLFEKMKNRVRAA